MTDTAKEAIANADVHLNNVGLPTYSHVMAALNYLVHQARQSDLPRSNRALAGAAAIVTTHDHLAATSKPRAQTVRFSHSGIVGYYRPHTGMVSWAGEETHISSARPGLRAAVDAACNRARRAEQKQQSEEQTT